MPNPRIAIIGAGPGGLTLARLLQHNGMQCTLFELDPDRSARSQGGMVDLHAGSGQLALREAGLFDAFTAHAVPGADAMKLMKADGRILWDENENENDKNAVNNEDEPTNEEVIDEISSLQGLIEQHSLNFHNPSAQAHGMNMSSYVYREVGMKVIGDIIERNIDGSTVAQELLNRLALHANDPDDPARIDHLIQICRTAGRVGRKTRAHASSWTFGSWEDEPVLFPEVTAAGRVVMDKELD